MPEFAEPSGVVLCPQCGNLLRRVANELVPLGQKVDAWADFLHQQMGDNQLTETEVRERVVAIVAEHFGVSKDEITLDTNFIEDLNADSLDTVELVMEFEDEFGLMK